MQKLQAAQMTVNTVFNTYFRL